MSATTSQARARFIVWAFVVSSAACRVQTVWSEPTPLAGGDLVSVQEGGDGGDRSRGDFAGDDPVGDPARSDRHRFRRVITITVPMSGSAVLPDFPFLVALKGDAGLCSVSHGGAVRDEGGRDIAFKLPGSCDSCWLSREIEWYDPQSGELFCWVRFPIFSGQEPQTIEMYYAAGGAVLDTIPTNVWDQHYVAVWHLDEVDPQPYRDSTANANHAQQVLVEGRPTIAKIGRRCPSFAEAFHRIDFPADPSLGIFGKQELTIEAWIRAASPVVAGNYYGRVVDKATGDTKNVGEGYQVNLGDQSDDRFFTMAIRREGDASYGLTHSGLTYAQWQHLVWTYREGNSEQQLSAYLQGELLSLLYNELSNAPILDDGAVPLTIGNRSNEDDPDRALVGSVDEVRISDIARSADWIRASFENQNNPFASISVGDPELLW